MSRYKAIIAYDGTNYHGWQVQKDLPAVAQELQDSFVRVFGVPISLVGVSRTDAGVHALGQVSSFKTDLSIDPQALKWAWNNKLPADIHIRSIERVADDFNIFNNVEQKTYIYHIFLKRPSPFIAKYGWFFRKPISLQKLRAVSALFLGTHDFRSFCTGDDRGDDTIRTIDAITIREFNNGNLRIIIKGPSFLRYMIRRLVGALMACASRDDISLDMVREILERKNPCHILPNAPAHGLVLWRVAYNADIQNT
jgi:tRNA pseudouridine38-40 synthase